MKTDRQLPDSKHFRLQQLAEGVYAAIHRDGGGAIGNAGIVHLGDRTLVYDTFLAPRPAEDLRNAAEALTGRRVDTVINSHWHSDHIWGNQVFSVSHESSYTDEFVSPSGIRDTPARPAFSGGTILWPSGSHFHNCPQGHLIVEKQGLRIGT